MTQLTSSNRANSSVPLPSGLYNRYYWAASTNHRPTTPAKAFCNWLRSTRQNDSKKPQYAVRKEVKPLTTCLTDSIELNVKWSASCIPVKCASGQHWLMSSALQSVLASLADGAYIDRAENILITGATGCGKSFLACALGHQACASGYRTFTSTSTESVSKLLSPKQTEHLSNGSTNLKKYNSLYLMTSVSSLLHNPSSSSCSKYWKTDTKKVPL